MSRKSLVVIGCLLFLVNGRADLPLIFEKELQEFGIGVATKTDETITDRDYRLPETVMPLEYDIDIDLNFEATDARPEYSYEGKVAVVVQAVQNNISQIVLHSNVEAINSVTVLNNDSKPVPLDTRAPFTLQPSHHFLKINLAQVLENGANYTLVIGYSSTMNRGPLKRGIWRGYYTDADGNTRVYATTHFQPYNARKAFPCWDEPLFKSVFKLHLSRPASYSAVFTNTRLQSSELLLNGRIKDNFLATPVMSSYLVTFLVSESFAVLAQNTTLNPPVRIIGRSNGAGAELALEFAVKMTQYFNDYFNIPYDSLHPNLNNDHISSPDWASAGTENWGMVSYRELYMFLDPRETTMATEHYAATLVSHELAHKWFGNLITCFWWSNTWINEGFASYFGYIATAEVFPKYEHHEHFNSRYLQTSLAYDSSVSSEAMNHEVNTPSQVTSHFGTISYSKGAAVLRMIADMITADTFRKACEYFLTKNSYKATTPSDLYDAFEQAINEDNVLSSYQNFNFNEYYQIWVNEPGYPVLTVEVNFASGEMLLFQERFFLNPLAASTGQVYPIPITYSTASDPRFTEVRPVYMMTANSAVLLKDGDEEWVIFNNMQHGYYRVNYNDRNWDLITQALLANSTVIHFANRAQIVDDVFAFMRAERMSYPRGFRILQFLKNEENYHVWEPAISAFTWLRNRLRHLPAEHAEFDNYTLNNMEHAISLVGYDVQTNETPTTSQMRQDLLHFACLLGHKRCIEESKTRFTQLKNGVWIDPKIRRNVYVVGVRDGDSSDFEFMLSRFRSSNYANDQLEMLRALAATRSTSDLFRYLDLTVTDEVRQHDKVTAFNYALLGVPENAPAVLQWLMNNIAMVRQEYIQDAPNNPVHSVMSNIAAYLEEPELNVYHNWLVTTQASSAQYNTAMNAITSARNNQAWGTTNAPQIINGIRQAGSSAATISASVTLLAAVVISVLFA